MPKTYNVKLNSTNRLSGNRNNATYNVNLSLLLPDDVEYWKCQMYFQSTQGIYEDTFDAGFNVVNDKSSGTVVWRNLAKNLTLDNTGNCQNSVLGIIQRKIFNPVIGGVTYYASHYVSDEHTNPPITMTRPTDSFIQISVFNSKNIAVVGTQSLLFNTDVDGLDVADMTDYTIVLSFEACYDN